jgi:hypothetical protein
VVADRHRRALVGARRLRTEVDVLIRSLVEQGRAAGLSWAEIGSALLMSRQAAHQHFYVRELSGGRVNAR